MLSTEKVYPIKKFDVADEKSLLVFRLIFLDKNRGVRLIGVGEVHRKIISTVVKATIREEIVSLSGSFQVFTGHEGYWEAAVSAMSTMF